MIPDDSRVRRPPASLLQQIVIPTAVASRIIIIVIVIIISSSRLVTDSSPDVRRRTIRPTGCTHFTGLPRGNRKKGSARKATCKSLNKWLKGDLKVT